MGVPVSQMWTVARYVLSQKLRGVKPSEVRVVKAPCMGRCDTAPVCEIGHYFVDHARPESVEAALKSTGVGFSDIGYFDNMLVADREARRVKHEFMLRVFDARPRSNEAAAQRSGSSSRKDFITQGSRKIETNPGTCTWLRSVKS